MNKKRVKAIIMVAAPMIATVMLGFMVLVLVLVLVLFMVNISVEVGITAQISYSDHVGVVIPQRNTGLCIPVHVRLSSPEDV